MSNPQWRAEVLAMTTAELADRNGAGLLALQLQNVLRDEMAREHGHAQELAYIKAHNGGLAVYWLAHEARRQGRKTLRVDDILAAMESASTLKSQSSVAADKGGAA